VPTCWTGDGCAGSAVAAKPASSCARPTTCSAASAPRDSPGGHELRVTGETARKRATAATQELTALEAQIARLACHGLSNPEIGARLFLSPRTVQYHLGNVSAELGISSRSQLDRVDLPGGRVAV
jgi:DNA-binding CsgD family transcriptional regulator